ncbi:MAG: hypothetical protein ACFFB6_09295, partial [Promethearchaeota archaeon]
MTVYNIWNFLFAFHVFDGFIHILVQMRPEEFLADVSSPAALNPDDPEFVIHRFNGVRIVFGHGFIGDDPGKQSVLCQGRAPGAPDHGVALGMGRDDGREGLHRRARRDGLADERWAREDLAGLEIHGREGGPRVGALGVAPDQRHHRPSRRIVDAHRDLGDRRLQAI